MNLYVRKKQGIWITFIHDMKELKEFVDAYIPGRPFVIGDIATFTTGMKNVLLKLIEENSALSIYSSSDLTDPILLSRLVHIEKEPYNIVKEHNLDEFFSSDKKYLSSESLLARASTDVKLRAPLCNNLNLKLLLYEC